MYYSLPQKYFFFYTNYRSSLVVDLRPDECIKRPGNALLLSPG